VDLGDGRFSYFERGRQGGGQGEPKAYESERHSPN